MNNIQKLTSKIGINKSEGLHYFEEVRNLRENGFRPANVADIMRCRLEAASNNNHDEKRFWMDNPFDTIDGSVTIYGTRNSIRWGQFFGRGSLLPQIEKREYPVGFMLDSQKLRNVQGSSQGSFICQPMGIVLTDKDREDTFDYKSFPSNFKIKYTREEAKVDSLWLALARGDKTLLNDYTDLVFDYNEENPDDEKAMGIALSGQQNYYQIQPLSIGELFRPDAKEDDLYIPLTFRFFSGSGVRDSSIGRIDYQVVGFKGDT